MSTSNSNRPTPSSQGMFGRGSLFDVASSTPAESATTPSTLFGSGFGNRAASATSVSNTSLFGAPAGTTSTVPDRSASVALAATTSTSPSGSASVAPAATSTPTALSGSASVAPASSDPGFDLKEATTKPTPEGSESQPHSQYNYSLEPRRVFSQTKLKITPGEKYNDLRLICEAHEFFVHRLMICTASPVIASALDGPLKEAESGVYTVKEFSARAVLFMIHWIYYGDYTAVLQEWMNVYDEQNPSLKSSKSVDQETMHAHLELNRLADYYDIYGLTSESRKNIKSFLASHWSACSMTPILLESDDLIADSQVYSFFVSATAAHLKDVVQEVAQKTDAHLPQGFMKDVLNKYFHASKPLFMSDKPGSS